eukprot:g836.t1
MQRTVRPLTFRTSKLIHSMPAEASETEALHQLREAHWESAALVPELQVTACYRNMDYGALQAPEHAARAMKASRRLLSITAQCQQGGTDPLTLKLNAESYSYLTGLLANMDSLYFMWSACLMNESSIPCGFSSTGFALHSLPFWRARSSSQLSWQSSQLYSFRCFTKTMTFLQTLNYISVVVQKKFSSFPQHCSRWCSLSQEMTLQSCTIH